MSITSQYLMPNVSQVIRRGNSTRSYPFLKTIILAKIQKLSLYPITDITISNKIWMVIQRGHLRTSKLITISNVSLYPISLYPISTVLKYARLC